MAFSPLWYSTPLESTSVKTTPNATRLLGQTFFTVTSSYAMRPNDSNATSPRSTTMESLQLSILKSTGMGHGSGLTTMPQSTVTTGAGNVTAFPSVM